MSVLNFRKNRIEKKERKAQLYRQELSGITGVLFSDELTAARDSFPWLKYLINAYVLFSAVYGTLTCLISSFELELNTVPLLITCIAAAFVFSFMYLTFKTKIIVYVIVLISEINSFRFFSVINTGINAMANNILKYIDKAVSLPFLREFTLFYKDEYTAMSVVVCILAVGMMMILNIFVSEKMSILMTFLITFPVVQIGMYFNFKASAFSMLLVVSSWVVVAGTGFTNAYNGLTVRMKSKSSVKNHRHRYGFVTDSGNVAKIAFVWLLSVLMVSVVSFFVLPTENFEISLPSNSIKLSTERAVKNVLSYGFGSIFSLERQSGSPGQLANVSAVYFDGKTDLKATVVDYGADRIYLRNFVGYDYNSASLGWKSGSGVLSNEDKAGLFNLTADILANDYNSERRVAKSKHKIAVRIVDPSLSGTPLNVPYYSEVENDGKYNFKSTGQFVSADNENFKYSENLYFDFYTSDSEETYLLNDIRRAPEYAELVDLEAHDARDNALSVPERNVTAIKKFCKAYNIKPGDDDAVQKVLSALESDFEYTLRPGKVPYSEDYVNYFLLGSQKGYCQHFASAATLIFRYLGIPARYAEGYVIDSMMFTDDCELSDYELSEWIETDDYSADSVSEISIPDSAGHAWVEIYDDEIGWVPVEATTAAPAEGGGEGFFSMLFGGADVLSQSSSSEFVNGVKAIDAEKTKNHIEMMFCVVLVIFVLSYFIRMAVIVIRRHRSFRTGRPDVDISSRYKQIFEMYVFTYDNPDRICSYEEFFNILASDFYPDGENDGVLLKAFEKIVFGNSSDVTDEVNYLTSFFKNCRYKLFCNMSFFKKLSFIFVKILF